MRKLFFFSLFSISCFYLSFSGKKQHASLITPSFFPSLLLCLRGQRGRSMEERERGWWAVEEEEEGIKVC